MPDWSRYQRAIFDAIQDTSDSLLVEAVAGSGKTTTLMEAIKYVPPDQRVCLLAFNKRIQEELKRRVTAPNACCLTLHAAGWAAWRQHLGWDAGSCKVDSGKTRRIVEETFTERERWAMGGQTFRLVGYAKQVGLVPKEDSYENSRDSNSIQHGQASYKPDSRQQPTRNESLELLPQGELRGSDTTLDSGSYPWQGLVEDTEEVWEGLIDHYNLIREECNVDAARQILAESLKRSREVVDYDDMLWLPIVGGAPFEKYDVVFVDEAQDVSGIQMEMISRMVVTALYNIQGIHLPPPVMGRVIAVGDRFQSIYGFRGAMSNSMQLIAERFNCKPLPLSISYRCPKSVVLHAQRWVKHLEYVDSAIDGYVGEIGTDWAGQGKIALGAPICYCGHTELRHLDPETCQLEEKETTEITGNSKWLPTYESFKDGDAILCRINRPLATLAFRLIRARVPCKLLGRDLGANLISLVKRLMKGSASDSINDLSERLEAYRNREGKRLIAKKDDAALAMLYDKLETVQVFMEEADSVSDILREIESMFGDDAGAGVVLSTIHKAKGLEWDRVFVLDADQYMPAPWAKPGWEAESERNLQYVAATRARRELRYIRSGELHES